MHHVRVAGGPGLGGQVRGEEQPDQGAVGAGHHHPGYHPVRQRRSYARIFGVPGKDVPAALDNEVTL
jgi:hypothetical protein